MKILPAPNGFQIEFPGGGSGTVIIPEIHSIDIESVPTMTVDVDLVTLGYENGECIEIFDNAEGFREFCTELSRQLLIDPPIHFQFPVLSETGISRVYERVRN
jgi:hypothetical protein